MVAVSGGVDSMVLLEVLYILREEYDLKLWVAHYDHRWRRESLEDALFVYRRAREKGLPFVYGVSPVKEYARREKISPEMAGRELRYRFFERVCRCLDLQRIALAHHADDLAEEVLLKFIRGAGRRGLAGIPVKRENLLIRPLLMVSREEIEAFAKERRLSWREDKTNRDTRFLRNRVRHLLIPFLKKHFHRRVTENLKRAALILAEEEELLEDMARKAYQKALVDRSRITLRVSELKDLPPALRRRVFWLALRETGVPLFRVRHSHLVAVDHLVSGKARGPISLPGNFQALRGPGFIRFTSKPRPPSPFLIKIPGPGRYSLPIGGEVTLEIKRGFSEGLKLKLEKISFPIVIRNRRPGDRIFWPPLGHKKLKKFFWEKGLSPEERDLIPIIEIEGQIVAIPGYYLHPEYQSSPEEEGLCVTVFMSAREYPLHGHKFGAVHPYNALEAD